MQSDTKKRRIPHRDAADAELKDDDAGEVLAESDDAAGDDEVRVNFRWGRVQVAVVRRAAELSGVPYQTYLKQVSFRQALSDLRDGSITGILEPLATHSNAPGATGDSTHAREHTHCKEWSKARDTWAERKALQAKQSRSVKPPVGAGRARRYEEIFSQDD